MPRLSSLGCLCTGCNLTQVVCAAGPAIFYLEVKDGSLAAVADTTLEHEVACIDVTPLEDDGKRSDVLSVGLWTDITLRLFKLPNLEMVAKEPLGGGENENGLLFWSPAVGHVPMSIYCLLTLNHKHL